MFTSTSAPGCESATIADKIFTTAEGSNGSKVKYAS